MGEKFIGIIISLLCSIPFYVQSFLGMNSQKPINFWSGDKKMKIKDIQCYNLEMFKLCTFYATVYIFAAIAFCFYEPLGTFILIFACTAGLALIYIKYRWILKKYSQGD